MTEKRLYTESEVAELLDKSIKTIQNWRKKGYIAAIAHGFGTGKGARWRYAAEEVERVRQKLMQ